MKRRDQERVVGEMTAVRQMVWRRFRETPGWVSREDMFQSAMEGVCQAAPRYRRGTGASFRTFALHRAGGAVVDQMRADNPGSRAEPADPPASLDEQLFPDTEDTLHDVIGVEDPEPVDADHLRQLFSEVDALPDPYGRTMRLYAEGDMTMREIAEIEGVTLGAISIRLKKARKLLQPQFRKRGVHDRRAKRRG